jgi:hypothetical protein
MENASIKLQESSEKFRGQIKEFLREEISISPDSDKLNEEYNTLDSKYSDGLWMDIPITINVPVEVYFNKINKLGYLWHDLDDKVIESLVIEKFESELRKQNERVFKSFRADTKSFREMFDAVVYKISKKHGIEIDENILDELYNDF